MAKYCRICTRSYAVLMPIVKDPILIDRIYAVAHVKVTNIDELSTLICNPCLETVSTIWEFYEHVQLTYETLSSKLASFYESLRSCRMCHCKYDNLRDLMNDDKICNRISLLYQIKIEEDSKIPNVVCKPCVDVINFSWKFFSKVQQKQIFLRKKFNINYEDDNLNDLNLGNDSNASSITDSDNLLEELYVVPVQVSGI